MYTFTLHQPKFSFEILSPIYHIIWWGKNEFIYLPLRVICPISFLFEILQNCDQLAFTMILN